MQRDTHPSWLTPVVRQTRRPLWFRPVYALMTLDGIFGALSVLHGYWWLAASSGALFVILFQILLRVSRR